MKLLEDDKLQAAIDYAGKDTANCIYLYTDLTEYGPHDPNVTVWYEEKDDAFVLLVLKYYDCFQVYSHRDDCDITGLLELIREYKISRVFSRKGIVERLAAELGNEYSTEYGKVIGLSKYRKLAYEDMVTEAAETDLPEIEELLLTDEENAKAYKKGELVQQFADRMHNGQGRNFIIRKDGRITAHLAIVVQTDLFRVAAYTMVGKEARGFPYGAFMDSFCINTFAAEGRKLYGFMTDEKRIRMFALMGNQVVAEYGKLLKKKS